MKGTIAALVIAWATAAAAAEGEFRCEDNETLVSAGDKVTFRCGAWIVSDPLFAQLKRKDETKDQLLKMFSDRRKLSDDVLRLQVELTDSTRRLNDINAKYYDVLRAKYDFLDKITAESIDNTRSAIKLARSIRRASYLSSALLGGATGAYLGSQLRDGWQPPVAGALVGAAVGYFANWAVLRLTGLD